MFEIGRRTRNIDAEWKRTKRETTQNNKSMKTITPASTPIMFRAQYDAKSMKSIIQAKHSNDKLWECNMLLRCETRALILALKACRVAKVPPPSSLGQKSKPYKEITLAQYPRQVLFLI